MTHIDKSSFLPPLPVSVSGAVRSLDSSEFARNGVQSLPMFFRGAPRHAQFLEWAESRQLTLREITSFRAVRASHGQKMSAPPYSHHTKKQIPITHERTQCFEPIRSDFGNTKFG